MRHSVWTSRAVVLLALIGVAVLPSCRKDTSMPTDPRTDQADAACRAKWGKGLADLPTVNLTVIAAHNENIQDEYRWAFSLYHAVEFGQKVNFVWRDVGGGGSSIETYLLNSYASGGNPKIDVLWGGGEFTYIRLAKGLSETGPLLEKLTLNPDVLANVPAELAGTPLYDKDLRWIGSALSGFGFIYNATMLSRCGIAAPTSWEDLAQPRFADLLELADPSQSASAAAAYRMIALSADDWPSGWAKLLRVLSNARRFDDSAGSAANAPVLGEALVATCIDFYGATRVAEAPKDLKYVSPRGQTVFTPDPIAILKDPPNRELAQRFVNFALSPAGQAMWALRVGEPDGPIRTPLGRQPIRRDVYETYAGKFSPWTTQPYQSGAALQLTPEKKRIDFSVLRELIYMATVPNRDDLARARNRLIKSNFDPAMLREFVALPENVATVEGIEATAKNFKDPKLRDEISRNWRDFFRQKYQAIAAAEARP